MHVLSPPLFISFKTNFKSTHFPLAETKKRNESSLLSGEGKEFEQNNREFIGKMSGNDIRDEEGSPIVLTDEHGNPVLLRDQNGNRIRIRGTAIRISGVDVDLIGEREHVQGTGLLSSTTTEVPTQHEAKQFAEENAEHRQRQQEQRVEEHDLRPEGVLQRTASSSSSSSSEDDGQGGRVKKKKGLTQKLKEKLAIGRHKDEHLEHVTTTATTTTITAAPAVTGEHEKKGMMEKIREKLPMHHNHRTH